MQPPAAWKSRWRSHGKGTFKQDPDGWEFTRSKQKWETTDKTLSRRKGTEARPALRLERVSRRRRGSKCGTHTTEGQVISGDKYLKILLFVYFSTD